MDGRSATLAALGVALLGIVASLMLEGVAAGLVLFVAGVLLVVIGIFGWHEPVRATALADGGTTDLGGSLEPSVRELGDPDAESRAVEQDRGIDPGVTSDPDDTGSADVANLSRTLTERLDQVRERVNEELAAPALEPARAETETLPDPLSSRWSGSPAEAEAEPLVEPDASPPPASEIRPEVEPGWDREAARAAGTRPTEEASAPEATAHVDAGMGSPAPSSVPTSDHDHEQPLVNHSDLVSHVRDDHEGVRTDGSTIQLRLLHEREHGASA